jgi:hypothetical protein
LVRVRAGEPLAIQPVNSLAHAGHPDSLGKVRVQWAADADVAYEA